jgi:hypothetical protein
MSDDYKDFDESGGKGGGGGGADKPSCCGGCNTGFICVIGYIFGWYVCAFRSSCRLFQLVSPCVLVCCRWIRLDPRRWCCWCVEVRYCCCLVCCTGHMNQVCCLTRCLLLGFLELSSGSWSATLTLWCIMRRRCTVLGGSVPMNLTCQPQSIIISIIYCFFAVIFALIDWLAIKPSKSASLERVQFY